MLTSWYGKCFIENVFKLFNKWIDMSAILPGMKDKIHKKNKYYTSAKDTQRLVYDELLSAENM